MDNKILKKKQKAAEYFTKKLLASKAGKDIAKVILFGSVARGEADDYSDIDLMIFANKKRPIKDISSKLSYDTLMKIGERVESHVYSTSEYIDPQSYFVYHAIEAGRKLYSQ